MDSGDSSIQISLIEEPTQAYQTEDDDAQLDKHLHSLESFLRFVGFCQYSPLSFTLSWLAFLVIGVAVPFLIIEYSYCSDCEKYC